MKHKQGFTLVELMLAVILSSIVVMATIAPLVNMFRLRIRLEATAAMQGEMDMARDFISDEIRKQKNGSNYLAVKDGSNARNQKVIRLDQVGQYDLFELNNDGELTFTPNGEASRTILTDVTEFKTELRSSPVIHLSFAIKMERNQIVINREFVAAGRNQM